MKHRPEQGSIASLGLPRAERKALEAASAHGLETNRLREEERRGRENLERRNEQRRIVEQVIEDVTGEMVGTRGMSKRDLTESRMAQYRRIPVQRPERPDAHRAA